MAKKRKRKLRSEAEKPRTVVAPVTVVAPPPAPIMKRAEEAVDGEMWINSRWRPYMAVQYLVVCLCDFIFFPVMSAVYQATYKMTYTPWDPITLKGGGLYHVAMGAIITATAYGRSQEKIAAIKSDLTTPPPTGG